MKVGPQQTVLSGEKGRREPMLGTKKDFEIIRTEKGKGVLQKKTRTRVVGHEA